MIQQATVEIVIPLQTLGDGITAALASGQSKSISQNK
jgi:hypothetical protein